MKILNLVNLEKSDIKYKISSFPDGQQQIVIQKFSKFPICDEDIVNPLESVQIKSRMNNFKDLEIIITATQSLKLLGVEDIHLYVPYFLGSRSDRQFEEGSNNYLKHIICPLINLQGYSSVMVLDPHSLVLEALITNFKSINNKELVLFAIKDIIK